MMDPGSGIQAQMGLVAKLRSALLPARGQGAANLGGEKATSRVCGRASAALTSTRSHGKGQCVLEGEREGGRSASAVPAPCTTPCSVLEGASALVSANISRKGLRVVPTRAAGSRVATISGCPFFFHGHRQGLRCSAAEIWSSRKCSYRRPLDPLSGTTDRRDGTIIDRSMSRLSALGGTSGPTWPTTVLENQLSNARSTTKALLLDSLFSPRVVS